MNKYIFFKNGHTKNTALNYLQHLYMRFLKNINEFCVKTWVSFPKTSHYAYANILKVLKIWNPKYFWPQAFWKGKFSLHLAADGEVSGGGRTIQETAQAQSGLQSYTLWGSDSWSLQPSTAPSTSWPLCLFHLYNASESNRVLSGGFSCPSTANHWKIKLTKVCDPTILLKPNYKRYSISTYLLKCVTLKNNYILDALQIAEGYAIYLLLPVSGR